MDTIKLTGAANNALSKIQDTTLNAMEEALFKAWSKANQIDEPDSPDNNVDYRGIYKQSGGIVLPYGELKRIGEKTNAEIKLQEVLQERIMDRIAKGTDSKDDMLKQKQKEAHQDKTHKQKIEIANLKLKSQPHELKMKEHDVESKQFDIEKQRVGNEGKQIDLIKNMMAPAGTSNGTKSSSSSSNK